MSDKQSLLKVVEALPDTATWREINDVLIAFIIRRNKAPVESISSVNPADAWAATAEADAGQLTPHAIVLAALRDRA